MNITKCNIDFDSFRISPNLKLQSFDPSTQSEQYGHGHGHGPSRNSAQRYLPPGVKLSAVTALCSGNVAASDLTGSLLPSLLAAIAFAHSSKKDFAVRMQMFLFTTLVVLYISQYCILRQIYISVYPHRSNIFKATFLI